MAYDIFISYRRTGGYETAKHLYDLLIRDGYQVSFDVDTLRRCEFDVELLKRIDNCTDFIIVLNEGVFDRCFDPNIDREHDWVRKELAHALEKDKNIIPIMLPNFTFPNNLPDDIAKISKKNAPKYDQYYFDNFYRILKEIFLKTKPNDYKLNQLFTKRIIESIKENCEPQNVKFYRAIEKTGDTWDTVSRYCDEGKFTN